MPYIPADGFQVVGAGDFNGDGQPDLLFQNATTGQLVVWYMRGTTFTGGTAISGVPEAGWQVKGVADYNNDGMPVLSGLLLSLRMDGGYSRKARTTV